MRNRSRKLAVLASIAAIGTMVGLAAPAGAGPTVLTGNKNSLGEAGSDTSFWMMNAISPQYNVDNTKNTDLHDYVTQIPPLNVAPFPAGTFVPADDVAPVRRCVGFFIARSDHTAGRFVGRHRGARRRHDGRDRLRPVVAAVRTPVRPPPSASGRTPSARSTT